MTSALCCDMSCGMAGGLFHGLPCWVARSVFYFPPWSPCRVWGKWSSHVSVLCSFPKLASGEHQLWFRVKAEVTVLSHGDSGGPAGPYPAIRCWA